MARTIEWEIPAELQPKPEDYAFDLDRALGAVLGLHATVPDDALNENVFDWLLSGLLTLMVYAPAPPNVMIIWNEVAVTDWICDPLSVVPPPPGNPTATVSPL